MTRIEASSRWILMSCVIATFAMSGCGDRERKPAAGDRVTAEPYLDLALQAEAWISSTHIDTERGLTWPDLEEEPERVDLSLYYGPPGVILFYLELHAASGEQRFLDTAAAGADELVARLEAAPDLSASLYSGMSGAAFVLHQVALATGEARFTEAAGRLFERVRAQAKVSGAGLAWIEPMPFSEIHGKTGMKEVLDVSGGAAGIGLAFLYAHDHSLHPQALTWATQAGDRLIEVAEPTEAGLQWLMVTEQPIDFTAPNFSHGTSGVAFFLARLYEATQERRFLDAALAGAAQLESIAAVDGESRLIYHHQGDGEDLFYLSWCHGPAGTGRLFYQLHKVTGDERWMHWLVGGGRGILATGVPEQRTPGFWNNISQCCGDAGVGELSLVLHRMTGDGVYLELAERIAASLQARSQSKDGGLCWLQAEHRVRPDFLQAHTGYMQGAAGVGSYFLHLQSVLDSKGRKIAFPDNPFPL